MEELSAGQASTLVRCVGVSKGGLRAWLGVCGLRSTVICAHLADVCRNEQEIDKAMAEMEELEEQLCDSIR